MFEWIFIVVGVGMMLTGLKQIKHAIASKKWIKTIAKIISSEVKESKSGADTSYEPLVTYTYQVSGKKYTSDKLRHGRMSEGQQKATQKIASYTLGNSVPAYYDQVNPENCVLERGFNLETVGMFAGGAIFTLVGIIVLLVPGS